MKKIIKTIIHASLKPNFNTLTINGEPDIWIYSETEIEPYGHEWCGNVMAYVNNLDLEAENEKIEISKTCNRNIANNQENAVYIIDRETKEPIEMYWCEEKSIEEVLQAIKEKLNKCEYEEILKEFKQKIKKIIKKGEF